MSIGGKGGGNTTKEKYGKKHFEKIGKVGAKGGGEATFLKYGNEFCKKIWPMTIAKYGLKKAKEWGSIGGFKTAKKQKLTNQENFIMKKLKSFGVNFETHAEVQGKNRNYILDFVIPSGKNPEVVIEVTKIVGKSKKTHLRVAQRLKERFLTLRDFYCSNSRFVAVINTQNYSKINEIRSWLGGVCGV